MKSWKIIIPVLLLAWSPWFLAAIVTWDTGTFEASPANSDLVSLGDDKIRELKENISARLATEMLFGNRYSGGDTGRSREGSARAYYGTADPSVLSNSATDRTGDANLGASDDGRLLKRSDTGEAKIWNGTTWEQFITRFTSAIALTGTTDLLGTARFTEAGADSMRLHLHGARHLGNAADPIPFHITSITTDTTLDATCAAAIVTTAIGSQVFGDAGDACLSVSVNFTGRTTTSRGIVIAVVTATEDTADNSGSMAVYRDAMANRVATIVRYTTGYDSTGGDAASPVTFGYVTGITAASHEFAVHIDDAINGGALASGGTLMFVDLGIE